MKHTPISINFFFCVSCTILFSLACFHNSTTYANEPEKNDAQLDYFAHKLIVEGKTDQLKSLLDAGFSPDNISPDGISLIARAAAHGKFEIAQLLISKNVNLSHNKKNLSPINAALSAKHYNILKLLIENGALIDAPDKSGSTPVMAAIFNNDDKALQILLNAGADPNKEIEPGYPPLYIAVAKSNIDIVQLLIRAGAFVNDAKKTKLSLLHSAIARGNKDIVQLLLFNGADPSQKSIKSTNAFEFAHKLEKNEILKLLEKFSGKTFTKKKQVATKEGLAVAITNKDVQQVKKQLEAGIDVNKPLENRWTYLMLAAAQGNSSSMLDEDTDNEKASRIIDLLIEKGAKPNAKIKGRYTALHIAAIQGAFSVSKTLLGNGANLNAKTKLGSTAADLARRNGHKFLANFLLKRAKKKSATHRSATLQAQYMLTMRGFKTGSADGVPGKKTKKAIEYFEWSISDTSNGAVDQDLLSELDKNKHNYAPLGDLWGAYAVATRSKNVAYAWSYRHTSQEDAKSGALRSCRKTYGSCKSKNAYSFYKSCFAIAYRGNGWGAAVRDTIWKARKAALASCKSANPKGCRLTGESCSDGSYSD